MICKWAFNKFASDFSQLVKNVGKISEQMAVIVFQVQKIAEHETIIKEHDRKLAYFEGVKNGKCEGAVSHNRNM